MTRNHWQTNLIAQGAMSSQNIVQHYGDAKSELSATAHKHTLCDLSHLSLLAIDGEDAVNFLQGQVTNDVNMLNGSRAHLTAHCNPKGRMLALFLAFANNNALFLQFDQSLLTFIHKRLNMYVLRAKVNITDKSNDIVRLGVNGPEAEKHLNELFSSLPSNNYALTVQEQIIVLKVPSITGHARFELFINIKNASRIWQTLKKQFKPVGMPCWDWLDIQSGIPTVTQSTQAKFIPQMLNLDVINGIDFKKGCYTGQEIVARTHYLGSVKRRTYLATISSNQEAPQIGDKLLSQKQDEVGQIVNVTPNLSNGFDLLAEMRIEAKETNNAYWHDIPLKFKTLPYSLENSNTRQVKHTS